MPEEGVSEGRVRAVARGGEAVVETDLGVVFVAGGLPGEHLAFVPTKSKGGARRGTLKRVLERSPGRREPPCSVAARCGGCPLMHATPSTQRAIKEGLVREACEGLPGSEGVELLWRASPEEVAYRRRGRLAWDRGTLGYRQRQSDRIVDIERCIVLRPSLHEAWQAVRSVLGPTLRGRGEILLHTSRDAVVVDLQTGTEQDPALFDACQELSVADGIAGVTLTTGQGERPAVWGDSAVVLPTNDGGVLTMPAGGFAQTNEAINRTLIDEVVSAAQPDGMRVLELHCGAGNFTVELARHASVLVAVEQNSEAVRACRENLASRGLKGRVVEADASHPPKGRYDVVVLDPPRQGARELFEHDPSWKHARRIVYVSCDTATLRRDLRMACESGFRVDRIVAFDMFPQTAHVETLVRLVR